MDVGNVARFYLVDGRISHFLSSVSRLLTPDSCLRLEQLRRFLALSAFTSALSRDPSYRHVL